MYSVKSEFGSAIRKRSQSEELLISVGSMLAVVRNGLSEAED